MYICSGTTFLLEINKKCRPLDLMLSTVLIQFLSLNQHNCSAFSVVNCYHNHPKYFVEYAPP